MTLTPMVTEVVRALLTLLLRTLLPDLHGDCLNRDVSMTDFHLHRV